MKEKTLWITRTGLLLALLIALQAITRPLGQLVTGSCVNALLALSAGLCGTACGLTVALLSPVFAWLLGIAPQILVVPAIMLGNAVFILVLSRSPRSGLQIRQLACWLAAACAKAAVLYSLVKLVLCGCLAPALTAQGLLSQAMQKALPLQFSWPQLVTALIGGGVAMLLVPAVKKAVRKEQV